MEVPKLTHFLIFFFFLSGICGMWKAQVSLAFKTLICFERLSGAEYTLKTRPSMKRRSSQEKRRHAFCLDVSHSQQRKTPRPT